jgi:hypothetical protein
MSSADPELDDDTLPERLSTDTHHKALSSVENHCEDQPSKSSRSSIDTGHEALPSEEERCQDQPSEPSRTATGNYYKPWLSYPRVSLDDLRTLLANPGLMGMRDDGDVTVRWRYKHLRIHNDPEPESEDKIQQDGSVKRVIHTEAWPHITLSGLRPDPTGRPTGRFSKTLEKIIPHGERIRITFSLGRDFAECVPAAAERLTTKPMSYSRFFATTWLTDMGPNSPRACVKVAEKMLSVIAKTILAEPSQSTDLPPITAPTDAALKELWDNNELAHEVVFTEPTSDRYKFSDPLNDRYKGQTCKRSHALTIRCDPTAFGLTS